jgi:putative peptide zinc metalloprotease protein
VTDTREPPGGATAPAPTTDGGALRRADDIQLIGEMAGSGYRVPPSLVRRGDGQTVQLTSLLYALLESIDGRRDVAGVAAAVSERTGRAVTADNVDSLVDGQLRPLGLLTRPDGSQPELKRSNPLLGLRLRWSITDPERTRRLTTPFAALFHPLVSVPLLAAFGVVCWWVFFRKGLAQATYEAFEHPGLLLLVFGVTILSAGFHEFGHAAAARRGGATPGVMGAGLYLVWPAFYTDVTDSYRLGRGGRVLTDLGGLYFNAIVAVAITGVWWVTGYEALLLVVATQILQMLQQLTPLVRFDGYHVLADVTGVPDLFHRIKPTLLGALPWRWGDPEARLLKPWARGVITLWVVVVVPMLLLALVAMVLTLPRILGTAWARLQYEVALLENAAGDGDWLQAVARVFTMLAVILPVAAVVYMLVRLGRQVGTATWRRTSGKPVKRGIAVATGLAMVGGLAWAWWPNPDTYRPIQPDERGTVTDLIRPVAAQAPGALPATTSATASAPKPYAVGDRGSVQTVWDGGADAEVPTEAGPQLAVIARPSEGSPEADAGEQPEAWVFPFDQPLAPEPGDNQALAVATEDGTVTYDVALALVWVEDGEAALNTNEAYAFASCDTCAAVSVAFQVVFVVGDNDVAAPQNLAGAVNYDCVNCLTYALDQQLFITLDGPLTEEAMAQLDDIWEQLAAFGQDIASIPLDEIQDRLDEFEEAILAVIEADQPGTVPSAPAESETIEPSEGASPTPGDTSSDDPPAEPSEAPSSPVEPSSPTESPSPTGSTSPTTEASPTAESSPTG